MSDRTTPERGGCPFHGTSAKPQEDLRGAGGPADRRPELRPTRKTARPGEAQGAAVERDAAGVWHVRGHHQARELLRAGGTRQAGFRAEQIALLPGTMRPPILYQEGEAHRDQRTKTARFFTPTTTDRKYRGFMEAFAGRLVADFAARGRADLSELSMELAVQVAAQVVGLTDSRRPGMGRRIEAFFGQDPGFGQGPGGRGPAAWLNFVRNQWRVGRFYFMDVRPAIRARHKAPREDVISHLLEQGYRGPEILTECITYAAAGMATTREFISAAAWHLLEHPDLRRRYLGAEEKERHHILHELLRLEPVVGHLYRRTEQELTLDADGQAYTIPAGALVDLHVYGANADPAAVGEAPLSFCPERERAPGVQPYALSFGDGHHRCPGAFIAIQETDIFLSKLLTLGGLELERAPRLAWNDVVKGYEIREFWLRLQPGPARHPSVA